MKHIRWVSPSSIFFHERDSCLLLQLASYSPPPLVPALEQPNADERFSSLTSCATTDA